MFTFFALFKSEGLSPNSHRDASRSHLTKLKNLEKLETLEKKINRDDKVDGGKVVRKSDRRICGCSPTLIR